MRYSYFLGLILLLFFICFNKSSDSEYNNFNVDIKPVSLRLNNKISSFEESSYIDNKVQKFMSKWRLNGASVAVSKNGRLVYAKGYGYSDLENLKKVEPASLFRLASVSKLITATGIMKLIETGKLSLSDKVFGEKAILNDSIFHNIKDKKYEEISIENLLRHDAGFSARIKDPLFRPLYISKIMGQEAPANSKACVAFQLKQRLRYKPGTKVVYSNLGYVILSLVIEKVTDMSYEDYIKRYILEPCGVFDMHIANNFPDKKYTNEVNYYEQEGTEKIEACDGSGIMVYKCNGGNNVNGLSGAGAWIGSAAELMKFVSCIDGDKSKPDILSEKSIKYMTKRVDGKLPIGWIKIDSKNNWWRTGTLAGSTVLLKKMDNGMSWVLVANTSSWRGSKFPKAINGLMSRVVRNVENWPKHDLFNYFIHNPIAFKVDEEYTKNNRRT